MVSTAGCFPSCFLLVPLYCSLTLLAAKEEIPTTLLLVDVNTRCSTSCCFGSLLFAVSSIYRTGRKTLGRSDRSQADSRLILTWEELSPSRSVTYYEAIVIGHFLRFIPRSCRSALYSRDGFMRLLC